MPEAPLALERSAPDFLQRAPGLLRPNVQKCFCGTDIVPVVVRLLAKRLGQRHCAIDLVIAVLWILGGLDHRGVRFDIRDQIMEGRPDFILNEILKNNS